MLSLAFLVVLLCTIRGLYATAVNMDSIKQSLAMPQTDLDRIDLLNTLVMHYYQEFEEDSSIKYALLSLQLLDSLAYRKSRVGSAWQDTLSQRRAEALTYLGLGYQNSDSERAIDTLQAAIELLHPEKQIQDIAFIYGELGRIYELRDQHAASLKYYHLSIDLYQKAGNKSMQAYQTNSLATVLRYEGSYGDALENILKSIKLCKEIHDSVNLANAYFVMGNIYLSVDKFNEALTSQQKGREIARLTGDSLLLSKAYNDIGKTQMDLHKFDLSLLEHQKALEIQLRLKDDHDISNTYYHIGDVYEELHKYVEARHYYQQALDYAKKSGFKIIIIDALIDLGRVSRKLSDDDKAMKYLNEAVGVSRENDDRIGEVLATFEIAEILDKRKQPKEAAQQLLRATSILPASAFYYHQQLHQKLARLYHESGNDQSAVQHIKLYRQNKDSVIEKNKLEKFTSLSNIKNYENKQLLQQESHISEMKLKQTDYERQKLVRNFSIFGFFGFLIMAVLFYIRYSEKNKINALLSLSLSNLKSTQKQLIHAEKMASLGELTAGVAHEIKNPLNFVNNFSELNTELIAEMREEIKEQNTEAVYAILDDIALNESKIAHHGQRADTIVKGMLQHSRSERTEKTGLNINKMLGDYLAMAYHGLKAKNPSFQSAYEIKPDINVPEIQASSQDLGQVFLNIISNAFWAVQEKQRLKPEKYEPLVRVLTQRLEKEIEIRISDNGIGIDEKIQDKIFQPFFTSKPAGQGTGLGLSMSYDIITKAYGGTINVETRAGEACSFIIKIPV